MIQQGGSTGLIKPKGLDALRVFIVILLLSLAVVTITRCTAWLDAYAERQARARRRDRERQEAAELVASVEAFLAECRGR